jgi:hypothetical protein
MQLSKIAAIEQKTFAARRLGALLERKYGLAISYSRCQDALAASYGLHDWNTFVAAIANSEFGPDGLRIATELFSVEVSDPDMIAAMARRLQDHLVLRCNKLLSDEESRQTILAVCFVPNRAAPPSTPPN